MFDIGVFDTHSTSQFTPGTFLVHRSCWSRRGGTDESSALQHCSGANSYPGRAAGVAHLQSPEEDQREPARQPQSPRTHLVLEAAVCSGLGLSQGTSSPVEA